MHLKIALLSLISRTKKFMPFFYLLSGFSGIFSYSSILPNPASSQMANFGQFLAKMGKTGFLLQKSVWKIFSRLQALINCKDREKSNEMIPRKMRKNLHFWAFWSKMANFGHFLAKMGKTVIFSKKKTVWNIFFTVKSPN